MYGLGIIKGMGVTLKHFVDTYVEDLKFLGKGKRSTEAFTVRQGLRGKNLGLFTVEYPDEKIAVPERFRYVPFLVINNLDDEERPGADWCTSCGICAKVCPPQCIWIVRGTNPETGRPKPEPEAFYIDIDICMNCGFCAEFCPFDAIKMDHDYELASYDRTAEHIYDKQKLSKEFRYYRAALPDHLGGRSGGAGRLGAQGRAEGQSQGREGKGQRRRQEPIRRLSRRQVQPPVLRGTAPLLGQILAGASFTPPCRAGTCAPQGNLYFAD